MAVPSACLLTRCIKIVKQATDQNTITDFDIMSDSSRLPMRPNSCDMSFLLVFKFCESGPKICSFEPPWISQKRPHPEGCGQVALAEVTSSRWRKSCG